MPNRWTCFALLAALTLVPVVCEAAGAAPAKRQPTRRPAAAPARANTAGNTITAGAGNGALTAAYNSYLNGLRQRIDNQWYLADGNNHVTLTMTVGPDGSVTALDINSSPKNTEAEQTASDAFNKVQPLPPLPTGSSAIRMTLSFDSRASQHENERHMGGRIDALTAAQDSDGTVTTRTSSVTTTDNNSSTADSSTSDSSGATGASATSSGGSTSSESSSTSTSSSSSSGP